MLTPETLRERAAASSRTAPARPINVNFFCHTPPEPDAARERPGAKRLAPYYRELGIDRPTPGPPDRRAPFSAAMREVVAEFKPKVVSFHFGLPDASCSSG